MSTRRALRKFLIGEKQQKKRKANYPGPDDFIGMTGKEGGLIIVKGEDLDLRQLGVETVPFTSFELPYIKHHGLRALCGLLMDSHSACTADHPFCRFPADSTFQFIVHVDGQTEGRTGEPVVALYFCQAASPSGYEADSIEDWAALLLCIPKKRRTTRRL